MIRSTLARFLAPEDSNKPDKMEPAPRAYSFKLTEPKQPHATNKKHINISTPDAQVELQRKKYKDEIKEGRGEKGRGEKTDHVGIHLQSKSLQSHPRAQVVNC